MTTTPPEKANRSRERHQRGDDPEQIAEHLAEQHGAAEAQKFVSTGIADAQREGDNYRLSIWREVRQILRNRPLAPPAQEPDRR